MADISIDEANAAIFTAEKKALNSVSAKIAAFQTDIADIIASLGSGASPTTARQYFQRLQGNLASIGGYDLQSVLMQYGLADAPGTTTVATPPVSQ